MDFTLESSFDLHLILVGAAQWLSHRQEGNFMLPDLTTWALHTLHRRQLARGERPTVTHHDTLLYLTRPLEELFEASSIPDSLQAVRILDNFPIETEFDLADEIGKYLYDSGLDQVKTIQGLIELETNAAAKNMKIRLSNQYRMAGLTDAQRRSIEQRYVDWRTFFSVHHNIVSPAADGLLLDPQWLDIRDEFYEPVYQRPHRIIDRNKAGKPVYWISQQCGLLYRNSSNEFQPITTSPGFNPYSEVEERPVREGDYVLKQTHQRRILIPGIPEMVLYKTLLNHPAVEEVRLYPGVDRYDLRVVFKNKTVHGIDVKDHRQPDSLENTLRKKDSHPQIDPHELPELEYHFFFYLLPDARVAQYDRGLTTLEQLAHHHQNLLVMTIGQYLRELDHV